VVISFFFGRLSDQFYVVGSACAFQVMSRVVEEGKAEMPAWYGFGYVCGL
jgi:hypothetical protein